MFVNVNNLSVKAVILHIILKSMIWIGYLALTFDRISPAPVNSVSLVTPRVITPQQATLIGQSLLAVHVAT